MKISKAEFLKLMEFPEGWVTYDMYPDELFSAQLQHYSPGDEQGSEHDRNGAFHWWLKRQPTKVQLVSLVHLSFADPDEFVGMDVRKYIVKSQNCDGEVLSLIDRLNKERCQIEK